MPKVLIVDDSAAYRTIIRRALSTEAAIEIVGTVRDGSHVISSIKTNQPDVVTLDLEMPGMNGLEVLKEIQEQKKEHAIFNKVKIIMVSANTREGANSSIQALQLGAIDIIEKPDASDFELNFELLKDKLVSKILQLNKSHFPSKNTLDNKSSQAIIDKPLPSQFNPKVLLIGSSTGGPQALMELLPALDPDLPVPILIVQHMPKEFTKSLAESLNKITSKTVKEAEHDEELRSDTIYLAPGDFHMTTFRVGTKIQLRLNQSPPENFCRPAVDVLFRSASQVWENACLVLVLTGMGSDGTKGLKSLKRKGAHVLVQDEASSVVWGMPGNVVQAGLADRVLPLNQIASKVSLLVKKHQS